MANIDVSVTQPSRAATPTSNLTDSKAAAVTGNSYLIPNNGRVLIWLSGATGATITVITQATVDGKAIADDTIAQTAGKDVVIGPFPPEIYNNSAGQLEIQVSANVNLAAFRL